MSDDLIDIEAIRSNEAVREAFVECYTIQGIVNENGMNVDEWHLEQWDRVECELIKAISRCLNAKAR